ncbi:uncharacterized protein F4822DRAFT_405694 [Hypoxylon trugodes]|uniref:uncharacterized protein n=1 Tax=Hypoxylon trugodes TaxID=326681 RepID=UPI002194598D|nr:uncharacterized protein F4822DRAFT_405694 [Hypoxylon trugodes]KAI1387185.1 hypothetical protein F4822DRAFT_405694 [Hypoxylon trugodes]
MFKVMPYWVKSRWLEWAAGTYSLPTCTHLASTQTTDMMARYLTGQAPYRHHIGTKPKAALGDLQIDCRNSNEPSCRSTHPSHRRRMGLQATDEFTKEGMGEDP